MAKEMMDIGMDEGGDLTVTEGGDFAVVESTEAHQTDLIYIDKGELGEFPTMGVGVVSYMNDEGVGDVEAAIANEFMKDGMDGVSVTLAANGDIDANGYYR